MALAHVSNVTGAVCDVPAVVGAARRHGALVLLDGAQAAPHGPIDVGRLGVDFYVFSGHKMFGPNGVGVLWGRRALLEAMPPFMGGGEMIREVTLSPRGLCRRPAPLRGRHPRRSRKPSVSARRRNG